MSNDASELQSKLQEFGARLDSLAPQLREAEEEMRQVTLRWAKLKRKYESARNGYWHTWVQIDQRSPKASR